MPTRATPLWPGGRTGNSTHTKGDSITMNKLKAIAIAIVITMLAGLSGPSFADMKMKMRKPAKGGYVHAHTFVKKNGTVVHVKGFYRHAQKPGKAKMMMAPVKHKMKMAPGSKMKM